MTPEQIEAEVMRKYPKQEEETHCFRLRHTLNQLRNYYRQQLQHDNTAVHKTDSTV